MDIKWKQVGFGVLAAGVGAAIFGGAMHYFLLGNMPAGDIMGISYSVLLPFMLGALGFVGAYGFAGHNDTIKNILIFGSAAAIGFGVAEYAGWTAFTASTRARARAPALSYSAPRIYSAPASLSAGYNGGTKMI
jgi:hypothetical protein